MCVCVCDMFCMLNVCVCVCERVGLHQRLQALSNVSLAQRYRPVGFWTLQGPLVFLAAHQTQHRSVQVLVLLLWGGWGGGARFNTEPSFIVNIVVFKSSLTGGFQRVSREVAPLLLELMKRRQREEGVLESTVGSLYH